MAGAASTPDTTQGPIPTSFRNWKIKQKNWNLWNYQITLCFTVWRLQTIEIIFHFIEILNLYFTWLCVEAGARPSSSRRRRRRWGWRPGQAGGRVGSAHPPGPRETKDNKTKQSPPPHTELGKGDFIQHQLLHSPASALILQLSYSFITSSAKIDINVIFLYFYFWTLESKWCVELKPGELARKINEMVGWIK